MNATGQRLAAVQVDGMKSIDRAYGPLSIAIAAVVMRYATPDKYGILRLTVPARALILNEVGRLLDETRGKLLPVILASVQAARDAAQEGVEPIPLPFGEGLDEISTVSQALTTDRQSVLDQTGALLAVGIAAKMAASQIARNVRQYYSPWFSQYRDASGKVLHATVNISVQGKVVRTERLGAVQHWPGKAGMASQHPRTVMLTETTRAHGETMIQRAEREGLGLVWNLSSAHAKTDVCDGKAKADTGYGRGVYRPSEVPEIPTHPRCRCFLSVVRLKDIPTESTPPSDGS